VKHLGAREILEAIKTDLRAFADPIDDISLVVIKRN
jgi:serine phosphatase RsbU (regulator of sigma subunit)